MKIEWASHFRPDGKRRNPPPSTIHGWLAKMRGTLIGNEHIRNRGMAEMRQAATNRRARSRYEHRKAGPDRTTAGGRSLFSLFRPSKPATRRLNRHMTRPRPATRPSHPSRQSSTQTAPTRRLASTRKPSVKSATRNQKPPPSRPQLRPQNSSSRRAAHVRR